VRLDTNSMAKVRQAAFGIEKRAYDYGRTPPAEPIAVARTTEGALGGSSAASLTDEPLKSMPPVATVSDEQASTIALKRVPGTVTAVTIERKRGKNVYVVEIQSPSGEKDILVDMESGAILGTE
jgi:uncharacterized membrane protein YkoI